MNENNSHSKSCQKVVFVESTIEKQHIHALYHVMWRDKVAIAHSH